MRDLTEPPPPPQAEPWPWILRRYLVLAALCLIATIAYIQRNSIAVAEKAIAEDLGLDEKQMGFVLSAFFLSYALFQIPSGWIGDAWGSRRSLSLFACVWSISTGLMGVAAGLWMLIAVRALMGITQAGVFPSSTNSISKWFPASRKAFAAGALGSFMSVGAGIGAWLTGILVEDVGWRWLFVLYALPGIIWAVAFYWWFRDTPREFFGSRSGRSAGDVDDPSPISVEPPRPPTPWLAIFSSPATWLICTQQAFRASGYMFYGSWFPRFLQNVYGVDLKQAGMMTALPVWAVVPGGILGGWIQDRILVRTGNVWLSRGGVAICGTLASAACFAGAYFIHVESPWQVVSLISLGSFFAAMTGPSGYAITMDMGGRHIGTLFGAMNMAGNIGATLFALLVPWFVDWTETFADTAESWRLVLFLMAGIYVAAAVCWIPMNARGTVVDQALFGKPRSE
ncbi:MAG: MFS transporter [Planctomycetaceae bacterium]